MKATHVKLVDQAVKLSKTVTVPTCPYNPLQLVGLDPDELVNALVAPQLEALPPQLHGAPGHPQEDQAIVLELMILVSVCLQSGVVL